jgi:hypothetical protein
MTNVNANSELTMLPESRAGMHARIVLPDAENSRPLNAPRTILQSALEGLSEGRFSDVVTRFDDYFRFNDHALRLEFTEKPRLTEFFEKSRELASDTELEVVSLFEDGNHAVAEWKLTATGTVPYGSYRFRISLPGTTIAHVENGKIVEWSDYYDIIMQRSYTWKQ